MSRLLTSARSLGLSLFFLAACSDSSQSGTNPDGGGPGPSPLPDAPACKMFINRSQSTVTKPELLLTLKDRYEEAWLGSAAVADLDRDGKPEIIVPRGGLVVVWRSDGTLAWRYPTSQGRIWASPVVGDFTGDAKLEVAVAARDRIFLLDAAGQVVPGFPVIWADELRALAGGDVDGDGKLDLVASLARGGQVDIVNAFRADGTQVAGFPPNKTGTSGCADGNARATALAMPFAAFS